MKMSEHNKSDKIYQHILN